MMRVVTILVIVMVILSTTLSQIPGVSAITIGSTSSKTKILIGLQFDQTCLIYFKMNQTCGGLTYKDIRSLENANLLISGKWVDKPYPHRELPRVTNHWIAYDLPFVVMADPDPNFTTKAYMIIIKGNHFTTINKDEIVTNNTRFEYHDRYVELPACDNALVYADYNLIKDTINYIESGCTKTNFKEKKAITIKPPIFSFNNQFSSLIHNTYLKSIFHGHDIFSGNHTAGGLGPGDCRIIKCNFVDPYKKPGW